MLHEITQCTGAPQRRAIAKAVTLLESTRSDHRVRHQREQRSAQQRAGGEAHHVGQQLGAPPLRQQQEQAGDRGTEHATQGGEQHDGGQCGQGFSRGATKVAL